MAVPKEGLLVDPMADQPEDLMEGLADLEVDLVDQPEGLEVL
tara:strand:- start:108 stop:233 length:126 start_codon:yes stop_codon:yes gene_type:complete